MTLHRCIWCKAEKPEADFNVEHVMPKSFGTFKANLTLVNEVCKECNDYFANNLEPSLARDSLEGQDRFRYGLKPPEEFSSLGKRSTSHVQISEGFNAGACGYIVNGDFNSITPFPQVGFSRTADGAYRWHLLDSIPSSEQLKAQGYGEFHLRLCACTEEDVAELLAEKGLKPTYLGTTNPPTRGWVEHVFRPGLLHRRALAKIALNYVARHLGAVVALETRFDWVRDLVLRGEEPQGKYYAIDEAPVLEGDKHDGVKLFGHFLVLDQVDGRLVATVSLFNRFRHRITLADETSGVYEGHFFDIEARRIVLIAEVAAMLNRIGLSKLPEAKVAPLRGPAAGE